MQVALMQKKQQSFVSKSECFWMYMGRGIVHLYG